MKYKYEIAPGDYTLKLKRAKKHREPSQIKISIVVGDYQEIANSYN
jgi:hypothetical protein